MLRRAVPTLTALGALAIGTLPGVATATAPNDGRTLASSPTPPDDIAGLREDLAFLARELPARHPGAFEHVTEADWRRAAAELDGQLATFDGDHARAGLARLVAMIGDAHTVMGWTSATAFPVRLLAFDDGIFVGGAPAEQSWAVGRRVAALDGAPIDSVISTLAAYIGHENAAHLAAVIPNYLSFPPIIHGADLGAADQATYTLAAADGTTQDLTVTPASPVPLAPPSSIPLRLSGATNRNYWNTYVPEHRLVYLQYNSCADDPNIGPFATFAQGMLTFIDQHPVERVVIDLRTNGGGDSRVIQPLIDGLATRGALRGHVFALIGRDTFSSAMLNAIDLKQRLGAVLVGSPTGGDPNGWGEVQHFDLPHFGVTVQHSTKRFAVDGYGDSVTPDIAVTTNGASWFSGQDPVLDAVLAASLPSS